MAWSSAGSNGAGLSSGGAHAPELTGREIRRFERLLARRLDPRRGWGAVEERRLREGVRASEVLRGRYDRAVTRHRELVGADPSLPSGFERQRMLAALLGEVAPDPRAGLGWAPRLVAAGLAVCAVVFVGTLVVSQVRTGAGAGEYVGARGSSQALDVGIGLSGVTEDGREYEAVAGEGLFFDDYLRIYTTRMVPELGYVFVFGLQDGVPIWYLPDPAYGQTRSEVALAGASQVLGGADEPFELKLSGGRHRVGRLTVVAVFSGEPLTIHAVREALTGRRWGAMFGATPVLSAASLPPDAVVRVVETRIRPGSKEEPR